MYYTVQQYFDFPPLSLQEKTWRARKGCIRDFLVRLLSVPFVLFFSFCKIAFSLLSLSWAFVLLLFTLGASSSFRSFFLDRISSLAKHLGEAFLFPFALLFSCFRFVSSFF